MTFKWLGALMIILGCGAFGFSVAAARKREENMLRRLVSLLDYLECELQYSMRALPDLCRLASGECSGVLQSIFLKISKEMEAQISPDVKTCMRAVLAKHKNIPKRTMECLMLLGDSLGRFDLAGQLKGLQNVRNECTRKLGIVSANADAAVRCYQTLGLCAGAALVILLI